MNWKNCYDTEYEIWTENGKDFHDTTGSLEDAIEICNSLPFKAEVYEVFKISRLVKKT